jgi:hypothetical protein
MLGALIGKIQATWNSKTGALQVQQIIFLRVSVTKDGVRIVNRIYWPVRGRNYSIYNTVPDSQTTKHTTLISSQSISTSLHYPFPDNGFITQ